ncbi:MAG: NAD(P)-dependent oxidoreductase [Actinomycetes bacterium]
MGQTVGVVGLGIMGSAFATNLTAAGFDVLGHDVDAARYGPLEEHGVEAVPSLADLGRRASVVITSLPSAAALDDVVTGLEEVDGHGRVLAEAGTLPVATKESAARRLGARGFTVLDTPISGTGAQAVTRDLSVYASGDRNAVDACAPVFAGFARSCHYVGDFGMGMTVKLVANLLVAVHNTAAAEALLLGQRAGVDPQTLLDVLTDGAGTSRMLEVRGPLMLAGAYEPATASVEMFKKDLGLISSLAAAHDSPVPLLAATAQLYAAAMAQGRHSQDAAAVMAVLEQMAGSPPGG